MNKKTILTLSTVVLVAVALVGFVIMAGYQQWVSESDHGIEENNATLAAPGEDDLLERPDASDEQSEANGSVAIEEMTANDTGTDTQDKQSEISVGNEITVRFKPDVGEDVINAINSKYGTSVKRTSRFIPEIKVLSVPQNKSVEEMVKIYANLSEVESAEPGGKIFGTKEWPRAPTAEYVPGEFLVRFKSGVSEDVISEINSKYEVSVKRTSYSGTKVLSVPKNKTVEGMVGIYSNLSEVKYAQPNHLLHGFMVPNDPLYSLQWHLDNDDHGGINMESAWDMSTGNGVVVAVLDSGVAYENYGPYCQAPDLAGTTFVQGYDFVNGDTHPNDDHFHGTFVTGTIAQTTNNNYGAAGVAFDCSIMPVKILDNTLEGTPADFKDGVYYAVDHGADIICAAVGGPPSPEIESAVEYAYNNGVTVIAAAGIAGKPPQYPAAYDDYAIAVGATRYDETRAYYSPTGSYLDLVAPGGDLTVDQNGDGEPDGVLQQTFDGDPCNFDFWFANGTSAAAAHVSGVAALAVATGVTGPDNVRDILQSTAEDKGAPGWDEEYGWGIVDARLGEIPKRPITVGFSSYEDPDYWYHIYGFEVYGIGASITLRVSKAEKTLSVHEVLIGIWRINVDKPLSQSAPVTVNAGLIELKIEEWGLVPYGSYDYAHVVTVHFHCFPFDDTDWTFLDVYGSGFMKVFDWEFSDGISEAEKNAAMAAFERGEIPQRLYSFILNGHAGTNDIYEPDDDWHELTEDTIAIGETQTHSLLPATENDWLRFSLPAESAITMGIRSHSYALRVELFDWGLNYKAGMTGVTQDVTTDVLQPGTYYVKITSAAGEPVDQYEFFVYVPEPPADWTDAKHLADIEAEKCVHDTGEILPPADTDWYKFTLLAAFDVEIEVRGDENRDAEMWLYDSSGVPTAHIGYDDNSGEGLLPKITAQSLEPDTYYFKLESKDDESLLYSIVLKAATPGQLGDSYEDDDTYDKARLITDGEMQTHSFYPAGDEDWVKFTLDSAADVTIETSGPGDADTEMWLYNGTCPTSDADTNVGYTSQNPEQTVFEDDFSTDPWSRWTYYYPMGWSSSGGYVYLPYTSGEYIYYWSQMEHIFPSWPLDGCVEGKLQYTFEAYSSTGDNAGITVGYQRGDYLLRYESHGAPYDGQEYPTWTTKSFTFDGQVGTDKSGDWGIVIGMHTKLSGVTPYGNVKVTDIKFYRREDAPPYKPGNPSPDNCAADVSTSTTLSWEGGDPDGYDTVKYDVYLGTAPGSLSLVCSDTTSESCSVTGLALDTTYYWKVVAKDSFGKTSETDIWSFYTGAELTQVAYDDNNGSGSYSKITETLDAGTYYVKVKEKNDNTADSYNIKLLVGASPYASFTYTPSLGLTTGNITFNASDSYDPAGSISSYSWDFDASNGIQEDATGVEVTHQYTTAGNYTVTLTVTGTSGTDTVSKNVTVKAPPVANFSYSGSGTEITFTDTSTDPDGAEIIGWYWDFEDGITNTTQNPTHVFEQGEMDYEVTLVVMDNDSLVNKTTMVVHAGSGPVNEPPSANFTYSQDNLTVQFNGTSADSDGSVIGWLWEFGDGTLSLLENPIHNYTASGTYTVTLTVTDDDGAADSTLKVTNVSASVIYVNTSGWWYEGEPFNPSSTPIQDAVNNASAGCCNIAVKDGIYRENVKIDKLLAIQSENGSANCIINAANPNDHVFEVTADYVNISGFTVKGATGDGCGIYVFGNNSKIYENDIKYNGDYGIKLYNSFGNCIYGNSFIDNNIDHPEHTSQAYDNGVNHWTSTVKLGYYYNGTGPSHAHDHYIGNYWSDYAGEDLDGDGIGDTPYHIDG